MFIYHGVNPLACSGHNYDGWVFGWHNKGIILLLHLSHRYCCLTLLFSLCYILPCLVQAVNVDPVTQLMNDLCLWKSQHHSGQFPVLRNGDTTEEGMREHRLATFLDEKRKLKGKAGIYRPLTKQEKDWLATFFPRWENSRLAKEWQHGHDLITTLSAYRATPLSSRLQEFERRLRHFARTKEGFMGGDSLKNYVVNALPDRFTDL